MLCSMEPMLSETYTGEDVAGWWMSEKFDGVRAVWTGRELLSRNGNAINAPDWFVSALPPGVALDGELWMGRGRFRECVGAVRRKHPRDEQWRRIRFMVFDAPYAPGGFEKRLAAAREAVCGCSVASVAPQSKVRDRDHMEQECASIMCCGAEGVVLREPGSAYDQFRSPAMLKYKGIHKLQGFLQYGIAV